MGTVYDRNKNKPDKGPNLWIKYKDPWNKWQYRAVGHINPAGLSKAQVRAKKKELRRLAKDVLTKIEGDVVAGKYGLEDESGQQAEEPTFKEIAEPWAERRLETHVDGRHDVGRMRNHLTPFFGPYRLSELDGNTGLVKRYIETKEREKDPKKKIGKATLQRTLALLSRFFNDYSEDGMSMRNPVSMLDRATRRRARPDHLKDALEDCNLSKELTWYQCTRHTFASHWVMDGRTLEKLREILGHSSVKVTERYAHLMPDMYCQADYEVIKVDLSEPEIVPFRPRKRENELHICDTERVGT